MTEQRRGRPATAPPTIAPPPRFTERRARHRRATDQLAHRETVLLARSLDILAADADPEARLAGLLGLLAETAGARRAAVVAGDHERRVAVAVAADDDPSDAHALAAWLDAWAPRSRADRAAAPRASVALVRLEDSRLPSPRRLDTGEHHYALLPIPSAGEVVLGFDFADPRSAADVGERLPPQLARHAAVALSLVTERHATDREVAELRARDDEQDRYVSTVAHELRTPLTGLAGYLELILGGEVDDADVERDFLERSRGIVDTVAELVSDLLDRTRIESGSLTLDIAPFSIAEAASRVIEALQPIALDRGIELRSDLPPRLRTAIADRRRVEQVLTNLVGNALKFSPSGTVVEVTARFEGLVALVAVRDDGPGIAPEDRTRIFEPFHRLAGHERVPGTGLGLPIARDLAIAMDGALEVASVPDGGSSFVLGLPGPSGASEDAVRTAVDAALAAEDRSLAQRALVRRARAGITRSGRRDRGTGRAQAEQVEPSVA